MCCWRTNTDLRTRALGRQTAGCAALSPLRPRGCRSHTPVFEEKPWRAAALDFRSYGDGWMCTRRSVGGAVRVCLGVGGSGGVGSGFSQVHFVLAKKKDLVRDLELRRHARWIGSLPLSAVPSASKLRGTIGRTMPSVSEGSETSGFASWLRNRVMCLG